MNDRVPVVVTAMLCATLLVMVGTIASCESKIHKGWQEACMTQPAACDVPRQK